MDMEIPSAASSDGPFEARYLAFLETITSLRPSLHRYCSRMTGSVMDGEDVVQDALFQAYRKLETFDDSCPLAPWLFRIAHNQCIDFLRRHKVREGAELVAAKPDRVMPVDPPGHAIGPAIEHLVLNLPPKERACVLLKEVFEYSLALLFIPVFVGYMNRFQIEPEENALRNRFGQEFDSFARNVRRWI